MVAMIPNNIVNVRRIKSLRGLRLKLILWGNYNSFIEYGIIGIIQVSKYMAFIHLFSREPPKV